MPTESITKKFVIKDEEACDRLVEALEQPPKNKRTKSKKYDEGKELLKDMKKK